MPTRTCRFKPWSSAGLYRLQGDINNNMNEADLKLQNEIAVRKTVHHEVCHLGILLLLCLGSLTHSLFLSSMIFHHAQCFWSVGFSKVYVRTIFFMKGLCALWRNSTQKLLLFSTRVLIFFLLLSSSAIARYSSRRIAIIHPILPLHTYHQHSLISYEALFEWAKAECFNIRKNECYRKYI